MLLLELLKTIVYIYTNVYIVGREHYEEKSYLLLSARRWWLKVCRWPEINAVVVFLGFFSTKASKMTLRSAHSSSKQIICVRLIFSTVCFGPIGGSRVVFFSFDNIRFNLLHVLPLFFCFDAYQCKINLYFDYASTCNCVRLASNLLWQIIHYFGSRIIFNSSLK